MTAALTTLKPVSNDRRIFLIPKIRLMRSLITFIFLHSLKPACSSAMIFSACGFNLQHAVLLFFVSPSFYQITIFPAKHLSSLNQMWPNFTLSLQVITHTCPLLDLLFTGSAFHCRHNQHSLHSSAEWNSVNMLGPVSVFKGLKLDIDCLQLWSNLFFI